jgi:rsbT co-antagonist protein RsbR
LKVRLVVHPSNFYARIFNRTERGARQIFAIKKENPMSGNQKNVLVTIFAQDREALLEDWMKQQLASGSSRSTLKEVEMRTQSRDFMTALENATRGNNLDDIHAPEWAPVLELLVDLSKRRARQGLSASDIATFIFSLKQPLFDRLFRTLPNDCLALAEQTWQTGRLLDNLGLFTTEVYQRGREEVIARQQQDMLELSTPVVRLWDGILALPLIGTLDSDRTQVVMESLLQEIVNTGSDIAIIDITGVPTVDTLVAQHLLKTVAAARLMGADCIISGIRPQIAQTIVHLGVELTDVVTKATLADAFKLALQRNSLTVMPIPGASGK